MSGFIDNYLQDDELVLWNGCHNVKDAETESKFEKTYMNISVGGFCLFVGYISLSMFRNGTVVGLIAIAIGILCFVKVALDRRKTIKSTDLVYYWVTNKRIASMCVERKSKIFRIQYFEHIKTVVMLDTDDGMADLFFEPAKRVDVFSIDDDGQSTSMDVDPSISFLKALDPQMVLDIIKGYTNINIVQGERMEDKRSGAAGTTHKL